MFRIFLLRRLYAIGTQLDTHPITYKRGNPHGRKTFPLAGKRGHWPENGTPYRVTVPWPGNVTHCRKTLHMGGNRFRDFENVSWFLKERKNSRPEMVRSHISANLSFRGIISTFRRSGRIGGETFPFGRKTLHMGGERFLDFGKRFRISETRGPLRPT